jgi:hypothetical protein
MASEIKKEEFYLNHGRQVKDNLPGKRIRGDEITAFYTNILCGYIREPHIYLGKFRGLCALIHKSNDNLCKHPRSITNINEKDCPILAEYDRKQEKIINKKFG